MRKQLYLFALTLLTLSAAAQNITLPKPQLSHLTRSYLYAWQHNNHTGKLPEGFLYKKGDNGQTYISALIKVNHAAAAQTALDNINALVGTKAGDVWTVRVPYNKVVEFTQISGIGYIQLDEPAKPNLDRARKTTRVDSVHAGINLPMAYSGKDVVVGVLDFGFDYNHPSFYDTLHNQYRVKRVWELNGSGPHPAGYNYGTEITDEALIKAQGTDNSEQTHGTCVAGMAAGSGYGSALNNKFRGMAYDADMVFVSVRRAAIAEQWLEGSFTDFIDGLAYIFNYAQSVGKPCVANVSWGAQSGPHDGSTLFNQALNNLSGPGKVIVMSAGNEGEEKIHIAKTFTPTDTSVSTFLTFTSGVYKRTWVDVWGEYGKAICGNITLYSNNTPGNSSGTFCIDDNIHTKALISANGQDTCYVQFITSLAESNGRPRMTIDIYNKATDSVNVTLKGTDCTIHTWNEYYYYGYTFGYQCAYDSLKQPWAVSGNTVSTVSDMGAGDSILLIGAYASKVGFTDINGNNWSYSGYVGSNRLVPFSSRGPLIDGRIKPDITAPGLTIATAVSSYDTAYTPTGTSSDLTVFAYHDSTLNKKFYYSEFTGTSASAPAASGIVALLLQANPSLGPGDVKDIITTTAITDNFTGALPPEGNNNWGHGKINAYRAIKNVPAYVGIFNYSGEKLNCDLYPNPGNGTFNLTYTGNRTQQLTIAVYNMQGQQVLADSWNTSAGSNLRVLDISNQPTGAYLVKVSSAEGFVTIKTLIN